MIQWAYSIITLAFPGYGLPYEKVGDSRREFLFWPLRGTKKGVVQAFFDP